MEKMLFQFKWQEETSDISNQSQTIKSILFSIISPSIQYSNMC